MKVGDFVRTNYGTISKLEAIDEDIILGNKGYLDKENIIKSSPNIIDLIEVGDYVNGREIRDVYKMLGETNYCFKNEYGRHYDKTYKIKSIVTKEQFEAMQYKVGE